MVVIYRRKRGSPIVELAKSNEFSRHIYRSNDSMIYSVAVGSTGYNNQMHRVGSEHDERSLD